MDINSIVYGYLVCALSSSVYEDGLPLSDFFSICDFADGEIEKIEKEIKAFIEQGELDETLTPEQIGRDFWSTSNVDLYEGHDGKLYFYP